MTTPAWASSAAASGLYRAVASNTMAIGAILVQCCGEGDELIYHKLTLDTFVA